MATPKATPTPTTATTPAQRIENYKNNVLPGITAKFPAYITDEKTSTINEIVYDVKNSGAEEVPPLSPDD